MSNTAVTYRSATSCLELVNTALKMPKVRENASQFLRPTLISQDGHLTDGFAGCALGLMYIGKVGDPEKAWHNYRRSQSSPTGGWTAEKFFANQLDIPHQMAVEISVAHVAEGNAINILKRIEKNQPAMKSAKQVASYGFWYYADKVLHPINAIQGWLHRKYSSPRGILARASA